MKIVGINGGIGTGKSTLAKLFKEIDPSAYTIEASEVISEVTNELNKSFDMIEGTVNLQKINAWVSHLPEILERVTGRKINKEIYQIKAELVDSKPSEYVKLFEYIELIRNNPYLLSKQITQDNKELYRPILQWVGGYSVRNLSGDIWFAEMIRRANNAEASGAKIAILGGVRFKNEVDMVHGEKGTVIRVSRPIAQQDALDPTESESKDLTPDIVVNNNGTLEDLSNLAKKIYQDILAGHIEATYSAV